MKRKRVREKKLIRIIVTQIVFSGLNIMKM